MCRDFCRLTLVRPHLSLAPSELPNIEAVLPQTIAPCAARNITARCRLKSAPRSVQPTIPEPLILLESKDRLQGAGRRPSKKKSGTTTACAYGQRHEIPRLRPCSVVQKV